MSKIAMVSHARHHYNGRALVSGESFTVDSEIDAQELELLKFASRKPQVYATRVMTAETPAAPAASAAAEGPSTPDVQADAAPAESGRRGKRAAYATRELKSPNK